MPDEKPIPPSGAKLHAPLAKLLRPLVRFLIKAGVTFPALCELLRELYINVAEYDFALPGKPQTDSRVSILTGVNRREVARQRGAGAPVSATPSAVSRTSRILALWLGSKDYCDAKGAPLALHRSADLGKPSFEQLVATVTRDVKARALLDDFLARRIVAIDAKGRIRLLVNALTPPIGDDQQLYYFSRNLHDHIAAAVANITSANPPWFERAVHYDGLSEETAQTLIALSREKANDALLAANREALARCDADGGGSTRWIFGVYVYAEPDGRPPKAPDENAPA
ncbi:hypothetical protein M2323_001882 [Rhodoblastus acidophilus]|uniref:DUF6502 family protein n=1 Tax=Rhodoblastus acidophilus TaxID=1074 RepID=UPI0022258BFD|nr:DUF6502 family protein [Rhodoblastus acidophilus]MCW2283686.1 hypothetical protein [Rhodoblastus acidophilus]MCW2332965.1 hypothetical protein [Rhodoblastus acidophilus]